MSANAPPGGGPNANVVVATDPTKGVVQVDPSKVEETQVEPLKVDDTPLVLEQKVEPAAVTNEAPDFGDTALNVAAEYFVGLGLDLNGRELEEAGRGNFSLLEAKLEVMGDKAKGSKGYVDLAKDAIGRMQTSARAKGEQAVKDIHEAVGGEANWNAVKAWAVSSLPADQLKQASDALNQGGFLGKAMAAQLLHMASGNPSVTVQGHSATNPNATTEALKGVTPLDAKQYRAELKKLYAEKGIAGAHKSDELKNLNARYKR